MAERQRLLSKAYFSYHDGILESPETLWKHWRETEADPYGRILEDLKKALTLFREGSPPEESEIARELREILSLSEHEERKELLRSYSAGLPRSKSSPQGESDKVSLEHLVQGILNLNIGAAFEKPVDGTQSFFLFCVAQGIETWVEKLLHQCSQSKDSSCNLATCLSVLQKEHTAFTLAVSRGRIKILESILSYTCTISDDKSKEELYNLRMLERTLPQADENVEDVLQCILNSSVPIDKTQLFREIVRSNKPELLRALLDHAKVEGATTICNENNILLLIRTGDENLWRACVEFWHQSTTEGLFCPHLFQDSNSNPDIIHGAVRQGHAMVVDTLIGDFPGLATQPAVNDRRLPLWYILNDGEWSSKQSDEAKDAIRHRLINGIIRTSDEEDVYDKVKQCKEGAEDSSEAGLQDIVMDFSTFPSAHFSFADYAENLPSGDDILPGMGCEKVLHTVRIPDLDHAKRTDELDDTHLDPTGYRGDDDLEPHSEVRVALDWLRDSMTVQEIKRLVVPDRMRAPHELEIIHECVKNFCVRDLDWRCINLCVYSPAVNMNPGQIHNTPDLHPLSTIESIHLYTDGNANTLQQWLGGDGLIRLKRLKTVKVWVILDMVNQTRANTISSYLEAKLKALNSVWAVTVVPHSWRTARQARLTPYDQNPGLAVPQLANFIRTMKQIQQKTESRQTRVAVIDDGFMWASEDADNASSHDAARAQIEDGKRFLQGSSGGHQWYLAGSSHGTRMAGIIARLDPTCRLFIAQVSDLKTPPTPQAVCKAIIWAVKTKQVDIISMSLSLYRTFAEEENLVRDAYASVVGEGVVVIHSTMDEGGRRSDNEALFEEFKSHFISITAADEFGNLQPYSSHGQYEFRVLGQLPALDQLRYIPKEGNPEGSSISTAIAAGLSSLTISCIRIANLDLEWDKIPRSWRIDSTRKRLKAMQNNEHTRFVIGRKFFGNEDPFSKVPNGLVDEETALELIKAYFTMPVDTRN